MKRPDHPTPTKCARCEAPELKLEKVVLYGKHGIAGFGFHFDAYICQRCGHAELYHTGRARWV